MSNWSQHSQNQQEKFNNGYGVTNEHNDPQDRVLSQPYPSPNKPLTISSAVSLNLHTSASQQLQETNVTVNLFDCMACSIPLSRCEVGQYVRSSDKSTQTDFTDRKEKDLLANEEEEEEDPFSNTTFEINIYHGIEDFPRQQENVSPHQATTTAPPPTPEEEIDFPGLSWDMNDYNFINTYIFKD